MTNQNPKTYTLVNLTRQLLKSFSSGKSLHAMEKPEQGSIVLVDFSQLERIDKDTLDFLKFLRESACQNDFHVALKGMDKSVVSLLKFAGFLKERESQVVAERSNLKLAA